MEEVIIFGTLDTAELAHFYLTNDSEYEVAAFTLTKEFLTEDSFKGLPIIPFERIHEVYSPKRYKFFAPMTAKGMNRKREKIYNEAKAKGYEFISYISSKATFFNEIKVGDNCFILEDNTIQPFVEIGNNVVLWSGNHIGHHSRIMDHVFFTSHVVLSGHCLVEPYCFLGVNSTIRDYTRLSEGTFVAMGANIIKDTEPYGVYAGNPAKKKSESSTKINI